MSNMTTKTRHSDETKQEAIDRIAAGERVMVVAQDLGIAPGAIYAWLAAAKKAQEGTSSGNSGDNNTYSYAEDNKDNASSGNQNDTQIARPLTRGYGKARSIDDKIDELVSSFKKNMRTLLIQDILSKMQGMQ